MKTFILIFLLGFSSVLSAQTSHTDRKTNYNLENSLAIKGYDPVAYFSLNKAVKGNSKISYNHQGVIYYFSTEANKKAFSANPTKYEPQYGGWCAYAIADTGTKVKIDPETFKVTNGKLYLFYNFYFTNTLKSWNKDEQNLAKKANENWSIIMKK